MYRLDLEKVEEPEIRSPTFTESEKKKQNSRILLVDYFKVFDCVDHNKLENFERDGNTRPPDLLAQKPVCR